MASSVLAGLRVVDFSSGPAGGQATTVLADFGAEVIKVEPPTGDRFRSLPASPFWLRGKKSVVVDLGTAAGLEAAKQLAATADVVVVGGPPSRLRAWGLDATLRDGHPRLVHCTISGWGTTGPYAELSGYEGLVAAKFGRMAAFDVQLGQGRPVYAAVQVATHIASQAAVQGVVAALLQRRRTGVGASVETSLLQSLMPFDLVDTLSRQIAERDDRSFTAVRKMSPMPTLNYHPLRTSDGLWIQCGNLLEHLFYSFLDAVDLLGDFLVDERFQGSPAVWSPEAIDEARDRILLRMQERTAAEWMQIFETNGNVAAEPILTSAQALLHKDLVEGHGLVQVQDPVFGATTQVAPIAELADTPAHVTSGAPTVGEHTDEIMGGLDAELGTQPAAGSESKLGGEPEQAAGRPLEGITILDLSTIIAAPLGMSMLADLGARVIKVEPLGGDPFRGMLIEGRMAVKTNVGKESICIDLKVAEGQAILHDLVRDADVLIHNFRGGVPRKLGIDFERLSNLNPELVVAVVNGYGPHGPSASRPATHPVMGACTGGVALQAGQALTQDCATLTDVREAARQIMAANEANPDPNTSVIAASAVLLALFARQDSNQGRGQDNHQGRGQMVMINMQVANGWANGDDFLSYDNKPDRARVDQDHTGLGALYRLYETSDGWVFLAAPHDTEFERLCTTIGRPGLAGDQRFATSDARRTHDGELAAELAAVFATGPADVWEALLTTAQVGCVRADGIEVDRFITHDPHMLENGWAPVADHARFGRLRRWGPVVTVDGPNPNYRSAPLAGEHTDAILSERGHSPESITALRDAKIVNSEPV